MKTANPVPAAALAGALGGLLGAAAGHAAVDLTFRLAGDASAWFKGSHGPPFFSLTADTSVYYACLAAALAERGARLRAAGGAFAAAFVPIWLPMTVSTRAFSWGEDPGGEPTLAWAYLIFGSYCASCALATWASGALREPGSPGQRGGLGALAGGAAAYCLDLALARVFPGLREVILEPRLLAPWSVLLNGSVAGALIGVGARWLA